MRCRHCGGLDTKRNGTTTSAPTGLKGAGRPLQRFWCNACRASFTQARTTARPRARFSDDVVYEAARLYVQGLSSYRTLTVLLEQRLGHTPSRFTLNAWVDELGGRARTPLEVSAALRPDWGGMLGVDGKAIRVGGEEASLLLGVDQATHDVVHALVAPAETAEGFHRLVHEAVATAGYPLRGLVCDRPPGLVEVWRDYFARVPLQLCRIHVDRRLDQDVPKLKRSPRAAAAAELKARIRGVLYAETFDQACQRYYALSDDRARYDGLGRADPLASLQRNFGWYMTHHPVAGLPADANITENVVKQLGKKLRLMEGFATLESAERFCRLLVGCYRFKRFTDSCRAANNGNAPLELAGVDLSGLDWLGFHLDNDHA